MHFDDLRAGGSALVPRLQHYENVPGAVVLGLARGGVQAAREVASALSLPLDLILLRPLLQREPGNPVRAVMVAGTLVLDEELTSLAAGSVEQIFVTEALEALKERDRLCRGDRERLPLEGRTLIVVDNGIRTGLSMTGAIVAARRLNPARVVVAVPVVDRSRVAAIEALADELVVLATPEPFGNAAVWYRRFDVLEDGAIEAFLHEPTGRHA